MLWLTRKLWLTLKGSKGGAMRVRFCNRWAALMLLTCVSGAWAQSTSSTAAQHITTLQQEAASGDATAQYNLGVVYHEGLGIPKDYAEAAAWFRKAADQGTAAAQFSLGASYNFGEGVAQDYEQAAFWYSKAAAQGNADAQCYLGQLYHNGQGVPQDYGQAAVWYRKAAEQGNAVAQLDLGIMYRTGQGVPKDEAQAAFWTREAADQGTAAAQCMLGDLYHNGQGVPQDDSQAAVWYRKAADQGFGAAQAELGYLYANGLGVSQDSAQAAIWYRKAAEQGNPAARQNLSTLESALADLARMFPISLEIESSMIVNPISDTQSLLQASEMGMAPPTFGIFKGTLNGERHWQLGCRAENEKLQQNPCADLLAGSYRGRWVHNRELLEVVVHSDKENSASLMELRYLDITPDPKNPPPPNDPVENLPTSEGSYHIEQAKQNYPVLVHVYGAVALSFQVGELPARTNCNIATFSPYQTNVNCVQSPPIPINRGTVSAEASIDGELQGLSCDAKWRWTQCSVLEPGFYEARWKDDKHSQLIILCLKDGRPKEIGYKVD